MKKGIYIGIIWLVVINLFGLIALNRVNLSVDDAYPWINSDDFRQEKTWNPIALHNHWDSYWFLSVARDGYSYDLSDGSTLSNIAFFPLYPLLIRIVAFFVRDFVLAGFLISSVAAVFSCGLLYKLVERHHPKSSPSLAVMMMLIFPTALFLNGVYSEALFLFLSIAFFYALFEKKIWLAGAIGLFAALTRITGLFLVIPFAIELFQLFRAKQLPAKKLSAVGFIPLGIIAYFAFHLVKFGDFFSYFKVQKAWGRSFVVNAEHIFFGTNAGAVNTLMDIAFIAVGVTLAVLVYFRVKKSYSLYMIAVIVVALATGTPMSIGRFILVLFPMYILLGQIKNERLKFGWMLSSTLLFALYTLLFVNNYWAG